METEYMLNNVSGFFFWCPFLLKKKKNNSLKTTRQSWKPQPHTFLKTINTPQTVWLLNYIPVIETKNM